MKAKQASGKGDNRFTGTFNTKKLLLQSATFLESLIQYPLNLSVNTSKFIGCPFFDGIHRLRIQAKCKVFGRLFFFCHFIHSIFLT